MLRIVQLSDKTIVEIEETPIGKGGQGDVYKIVNSTNSKKLVLKIYHESKRTPELEKKISYLISNTPRQETSNNHHSVIWPLQLAYIGNLFIGFTMYQSEGIVLDKLCSQILPNDLGSEWKKFQYGSEDAIKLRLKLCYNIAAALDSILSLNKYVIGDLKPSNIIVKSNGLISLIDIDSIDIIENGKALHLSSVVTPEYAPPEYYRNISSYVKSVHWDYFSYAVIVYQLLTTIHPYTGTLKLQLDNMSRTQDKIKLGYLPVGEGSDRFSVIPPPHNNFFKLDKTIQTMLIKALAPFENNTTINRPNTKDWCQLLFPDYSIKVGRKLPSKNASYLQPVYSNMDSLNPLPYTIIKKPAFINTGIKPGFATYVYKLLNMSGKKNKKYLIWKIQDKIEGCFKDIEKLILVSNEERIRYEESCRNLIEQEHLIVNSLKEKYSCEMHSIDERAEIMFRNEYNEMEKLENQFSTEKQNLENQISKKRQEYLTSLETKYKFEQDLIQIEIQKLNQRRLMEYRQIEEKYAVTLENEQQTINKLNQKHNQEVEAQFLNQKLAIEQKIIELDNKQNYLLTTSFESYKHTELNKRLRECKLRNDSVMIFSEPYYQALKFISNLESFGIRCAADIIRTNESGGILKANGVWVKVPDIGRVRSKNIMKWCKKMEMQILANIENVGLPSNVVLAIKAPIEVERKALKIELQKILDDIHRMQQIIPEHLKRALENATVKESYIYGLVNTDKMKVTERFEAELAVLKSKSKDIDTSYYKTRTEREFVYVKSITPFQEKIKNLQNSYEEVKQKIESKYNTTYNQLISEAELVEYRFSCELKEINNKYKSQKKSIYNSNENLNSTFLIQLNQIKNQVQILSNQLDSIKSNI